MQFKRLIRFRDALGNISYGEAPESGKLVGRVVSLYAGEDPWSLRKTDKSAEIVEVGIAHCTLSPNLRTNRSRFFARCLRSQSCSVLVSITSDT
jgi:hypothetical protein